MKRCRDCGETKPKNEFCRDASQKDGLHIYCRVCHNKRTAAWHAANPGWKRDRPGYNTVYAATHRALNLQATPTWRDQNAIDDVFDFAAMLQGLACKPHHVDHFFPLNSKIGCGLHVHNNLHVLPGRQNCSKSNRWPTDEEVEAFDRRLAE